NDDKKNGNQPETFDLLGFTHYWGKTLKGGWAVQRKTMKARLARAVKSVDEWRRENLHKAVKIQWRKLCEKVRGHYVYYGITGTGRSVQLFLHQVRRSWQRRLNRRNRVRSMPWDLFRRLIKRYLYLPQELFIAFSAREKQNNNLVEQSFEEPYAVMSASTGLWEAWEINLSCRPGKIVI
ncbi:MAG: hypothetical protein LBT05_16020, partial [Planctomycetaceae bacterium]|nr:hypothetical protein [Planctomycetaceae bacterium]